MKTSLLTFTACLAALPAMAQIPPSSRTVRSDRPAVSREESGTVASTTPDRTFVGAGVGTFGGTRISWRSAVEEFSVPGPGGTPGASIFATSYVRSGGNVDPGRPVIFAFNGGPGSSSLWLHLGFLGPRRVDMDDPAKPQTTPPFRTVDNPDSPLDAADIVMIDPPGTGWSTIQPGGKPEQFYGVQQDAQATVQVIREWLRRHGRTNAPKYILSESYGTVRAAVVARLLAGGPTETGEMTGITLDGVILLGQALDYSGRGEGDDRSYVSILPSLAATACQFRKVQDGCTPEGQADAARRFIATRYVAALNAGSRLPDADRSAVATELSALTGLPADMIRSNDLRVSAGTFARTLLAEDRRRLGLYDARFTLPLNGGGSDPVADDPAMGQYVPGFVAAWSDYARDALHVRLDQPYQPIAFRSVNARWDYGSGPGVPAGRNFAGDLAIAMTRNPRLRLLVGTGWYDLVTPVGAAEYVVTHSGIPLAQTEFRYYRAGHMSYLGAEPRSTLARDVRSFVTAR